MNISAKVEYACIALLELSASYGSGRPVQIRRIAEANGVPFRFLVQILLQLKGAGLVASTRGASGGYQLTKAPDDVTLGEVMRLIDGTRTQGSNASSRTTDSSRVLMDFLHEVSDVQWALLDRMTFAELLERSRVGAQDMYYI